MASDIEELRAELNAKQKEVMALIADISDAEAKLNKLRVEVTELYEKINGKLDN